MKNSMKATSIYSHHPDPDKLGNQKSEAQNSNIFLLRD